MPSNSYVVFSERQSLMSVCREAIDQSLAHQVDASSLSRAKDALQNNPQLVVVDATAPDFKTVIDIARATPILLLASDRAQIETFLFPGVVLNYLLLEPDNPCFSSLSATLECLLLNNKIELSQHFPCSKQRVITVTSSAQIHPIVEQVEAFALEAGCHKQIAQNLGVVSDELLSNALYNAPLVDGERPYAKIDRRDEVTLSDEMSASLTLATDGKQIGLMVEDCFGSLDVHTVRRHLRKAATKDKHQVNMTNEGGAGIGLFFVYNLVHHFMLRVDPHVSTQAAALVDISKSYRKFTTKTKLFNLFLANE